MINRKFNTPKKDKKEEEEKKTSKKKEVLMKNLVTIEGMPGNIKTDIVLNVDRSVIDFQKELEEIKKTCPDNALVKLEEIINEKFGFIEHIS